MTLESVVSPQVDAGGLFGATTGTLLGIETNTGQSARFGTNIDHLVTRTVTGNTPGIAAGAGAGTSPTVTLGAASNDVKGIVNVTTGTTATTAATLATVTFGTAYTTAPVVMLEPANAATAALSVAATIFVGSASTTAFTLKTNGTAPADATAYSWFYHVIG